MLLFDVFKVSEVFHHTWHTFQKSFHVIVRSDNKGNTKALHYWSFVRGIHHWQPCCHIIMSFCTNGIPYCALTSELWGVLEDYLDNIDLSLKWLDRTWKTGEKQQDTHQSSTLLGSSWGVWLHWWLPAQRSSLIARFMGPIWGPSGADRSQVGPMLVPWTFLSRL